jgi:cytochrome c oxidase cbb3-type subunit 4
MTFETLRLWALNSGLIYFVALTIVVIAYVLKPSNRARFERAARMPLESD